MQRQAILLDYYQNPYYCRESSYLAGRLIPVKEEQSLLGTSYLRWGLYQ